MSLLNDIDRGLEIVDRMALLKAELDAIVVRIENAALKGKQIPLEDAERDGMQYLARGSEQVVPVIITADYLSKSFTEGSDAHAKISAVAGGKLAQFFKKKTVHERLFDDDKVFRKKAREILGSYAAEPFITACIARDKFGVAKNAVKIDWARARAIGEEVAA